MSLGSPFGMTRLDKTFLCGKAFLPASVKYEQTKPTAVHMILTIQFGA